MGSKRNSFSETKNPSVNLRKQEKTELHNGTVRNITGHSSSYEEELGPGNADFVRDAGDTDLSDLNEKASQWFGTGELEIVRPETHPEAFVPVAPDGSWSWMVLLASFSCSIIIDGITFSVGLLLADLADCFKTTKAKVALVGSLFLGCYQIIGPVAAALINRFGCRAVAITGSLLASVALFTSSFATNMDFLLCTFGVVAGSSFGLIHLPAMISVNFYFNRRRAMANGIAVVGTPVGAVIFGPLTSYLLKVYHWSNTLIIFAGLLLHCVAFACLYRPLLPAVRLSGVHAHSVPEGLDDLIAEEINSGFFTSNGYLQSIVTIASNSRIVPPSIRVDDPTETKPLLCNEEVQTPNGKTEETALGSSKTCDDEHHADDGNVNVQEKSTQSSGRTKPLSTVRDRDANGEVDSHRRSPPNTDLGTVGQSQLKVESTNAAQSKRPVDIPSIQTPGSLEIKFRRFRRFSNVSCILSTPCLGGFQTYQDRLSGPFRRLTREHHRGRLLHPIKHRIPVQRCDYDRFQKQQEDFMGNNGGIGVNRQSSTSRPWKHLSGIPTIEEGHILEHIPTNATNLTSLEFVSSAALAGAREYSSSITVAGLAKDYGRGQRQHGSPSIKSGPSVHHSAFSGLAVTTNTFKVELARINDKPAVVMLPHPDVSIRDYSRPMYRSDIFYSGNVAPESGMTAQVSGLSARSQGFESQTRIHELISSAFSLRPENTSRRVSISRPEATPGVVTSVDPEADTFLSQPNWYESYLVSLTRIPVGPVDYEEHSVDDSAPCWCCPGGLFCCDTEAGLTDGDVDHGTDSLQRISLCDCCLTCIRRLRDCRLPLAISRTKAEMMQVKNDPHTSASKSDAAGDVMSEVASEYRVHRCLPYRPRICTSKAFTDVLGNMTDVRLIRNKGYRFAFAANFFAVLGTYVPLIYVTEFAVQNGIPDSMCSYFISIMGLLSIVGRLAFAWLCALLGIRPIMIQTTTQFLLGLLLALMPLFVSFASQATAFGLMGLLSGPFASLSTIILCDLVGVDALTTAVGLVTLSRGLSSVLGAPLAGLLYEWTGDFTVPYVASGMTIILSGVLFGVIICLRKESLDILNKV
ncbi:Monocarboxylate transporter 12 [Fasciola hepatica]|uniref:Monocarboxylate transporter 12 n=1 Tax=Fasciola hepatica TaxID=6192 RepID=A0A4E0RIQ3_FASHE|nr:Monocarboxylate transporter 12 [Fasciola hepatica]